MQNNLVMFCLEEKKSILETKSDVEEFFHHLVGGDVSIKDPSLKNVSQSSSR